MRIADVRTHVLEAPLSEPFHWSFNGTSVREACIVEIVAEDGTAGWGECFGPAALNAAIVRAYARTAGRRAMRSRPRRIWEDLYGAYRDQGQKGLAISALSGVDIALWDLKGKHFGVPVHRLHGRAAAHVGAGVCHGHLPASSTAIRSSTSSTRSRATSAQGFHAAKLKIGFDVEADAGAHARGARKRRAATSGSWSTRTTATTRSRRSRSARGARTSTSAGSRSR